MGESKDGKESMQGVTREGNERLKERYSRDRERQDGKDVGATERLNHK